MQEPQGARGIRGFDRGKGWQATVVPSVHEGISGGAESVEGGCMSEQRTIKDLSRRVERIGNATLYLGDSREILPALPSADLILTDPPYGIGEAAGKNKSRGSAQGANKWKGTRNTTGAGVPSKDFGSSEWDNEPPPAWFMAMMLAKSKYQIIFGGNYYALPPTTCVLVWDKDNGETDFADCELAWTNLKKAVRIKKWRWNGMLQEVMGRKEERHHPTQKPVAIMEWAITQAPDEVVTVCDPFMGSGTTGVACANMGKTFIGIEREEKYFDVACQRIAAAQAQGRLIA
jgi:DNA modification methylase